MGKRRQRRLRKKEDKPIVEKQPEIEIQQERTSRGNAWLDFYDINYKKLLIIPFVILFLAIGQLIYQDATTGDFMNKGVSLKGGVTLTVPGVENIIEFENQLRSKFPEYDYSTRKIATTAEIEVDATTNEEANALRDEIMGMTGLEQEQIGINLIGSSLGASFFIQTFRAMIAAFILMGSVVFLYFAKREHIWIKTLVACMGLFGGIVLIFVSGSWVMPTIGVIIIILLYFFIRYSIPSFAVILAAFADIVITLAIVNTLGIKVSTAGIAAFLMLIGYSIDTDILLSTRVLKRKEGDVFERVMSAFKTGITMNVTTLIALVVGMILSQSAVLSQILTILFIGLLVDIINTWLQNVGILRWYIEKNE